MVHARLQNFLNRWGDRIEAAATANMFEPETAYMTWPQGRVFYDSYRFWNQTSGHVDQMFTKEWLPWVLDVKEQSPTDSLDVLVKSSDDGQVISMYVVNYGLQLKERSVQIKGFSAAGNAIFTQLGPHPFSARNSGENPDLITPVVVTKKIGKHGFTHQFPGHSFTMIRMAAK
jgi:alpha-L-arabinofuranosidase